VSRLAVVGAGVMGGSLVRGLLDAGWGPGDVVVTDVIAERRDAVASELGIEAIDDNAAAAAAADTVLLAVKPQEAVGALESLVGTDTAVISIVAGMRTATIEEIVGGGVSVVRAMPNSPARVGRGATALTPGRNASDDTKALASEVFSVVGEVVWLDEDQLDAVTALSGSGPAYVFYLAEAMLAAAKAHGLPADVARTLASATIEGAGRMLSAMAESPEELRAQVTSKGGTTAAAVEVLESRGVRDAIVEALGAALRRSKELGAS
jgi:pyrroline-5-carboxylate reductase